MSVLSYYDLFPFGLGLDLAGATLLARGLCTRSDRPTNSHVERSPVATRSVASRFAQLRIVPTSSRLAFSLLGFFAQGVGYVLYIGGAQSKTHGDSARLVAVALLLTGLLAGFLIPHLTRARRIRRYLIALARYDERGTRHDLPLSEELCRYAVVQGNDPSFQDYPHFQGYGDELTGEARRYWNVTRVRTIRDDQASYEAAARLAEGR